MRGAFLIFGFLSILPEAQSKGLIDQLTEWKEGQRGFPTEIFRKIEHMEFEKRRNQKRLAKAVSEIFDRVSIAKLLTLTESEFEELFEFHLWILPVNRFRFDAGQIKFGFENEPGGDSSILKRRAIQSYAEDALLRLAISTRRPLFDNNQPLPPALQRINSTVDKLRDFLSSKKVAAILGAAVPLTFYFASEPWITNTTMNATMTTLIASYMDRSKKLQARLGIERLRLAAKYAERERIQFDAPLSFRIGQALKGHLSEIACPNLRPCTAAEAAKAVSFQEGLTDIQWMEGDVDFFGIEVDRKPIIGVSQTTKNALGGEQLSPASVSRHFRESPPQGVWLRFPELAPRTAIFHPIGMDLDIDLRTKSVDLLISPYAANDPGRRLRTFPLQKHDSKDAVLQFSDIVRAAQKVGLVNPTPTHCSASVVDAVLRRLFISGR